MTVRIMLNACDYNFYDIFSRELEMPNFSKKIITKTNNK